MDLTSWLTSGNLKSPSVQGLPDPSEGTSHTEAHAFEAANTAAEAILTPIRKRKRGDYQQYDDETRAKIARCSIDIGCTKAAKKFSSELERTVSITTVRSMRDQFIKLKKQGATDSSITTLPKSPRGNPLLLGPEMDDAVQAWIRKIRLNGGVVNARIVMAGIEAIVTRLNRGKLQKFGGHIQVTKHLARSILRRMGFVKRKGTKSMKRLPSDFEEIKDKYVTKVTNVVTKHNIPDTLIINWDQTGCQLVPGGDWTMAARGSQQVTFDILW